MTDDLALNRLQCFPQGQGLPGHVFHPRQSLVTLGRFNQSIQWLYLYCVKEILTREGDEKDALAICDTYLNAAKRNP